LIQRYAEYPQRQVQLNIKLKIWIEEKGKPVFGTGRRTLLDALDRRGSISRAAQKMNISYRKAWGALRAMEERLGLKLVDRRTGGREGGVAGLTRDARMIMERFDILEKDLRKFVDARFKKVFSPVSQKQRYHDFA
jgi:molybdate transport system regulatory protein